MNLKINGETEAVGGDSLTVTELLTRKKVRDPDMVSVQLNGAFVDRTAFARTSVKEGDEVEFLYFMGGGN